MTNWVYFGAGLGLVTPNLFQGPLCTDEVADNGRLWMWPFRKKETLPDCLKRESVEAQDLIAEKWLIYRQLKFKDDVPFSQQILLFMEPAVEGILKAKPVLASCPSEMMMLILMNGIVQTGTHSALEVQDALGIPRAV